MIVELGHGGDVHRGREAVVAGLTHIIDVVVRGDRFLSAQDRLTLKRIEGTALVSGALDACVSAVRPD